MALRAERTQGARRLALPLVLAGVLTLSVGISGQAAGDETGPPPATPTGSAPPADPGGAAPTTAPAVSEPPAPAPPLSGQPTANPADAPPQAAASATSPAAVTSPEPSVSVRLARATTSAAQSVSIVDYDFKPGSITVNKRDAVQWTNYGKVPEGHDVTGDGLKSGNLKSGDTYSHTFNATGTFSYICSIHPIMKGTVKVLAATSSGGGGIGGSGGSNGSGSGGSAGGGSGAGDSSAATGSESAAVSSPDAAGSSSSLPATGSDSLDLSAVGLVLLGLGLALRLLPLARAGRRA
jgi:LPXTG-motif cell wall-anchored protein